MISHVLQRHFIAYSNVLESWQGLHGRIRLSREIFYYRGSSTMRDPVVTVKQGKLKGVVQQSVLGSSYFSFKGIPFAVPPIGKLRFMVRFDMRNYQDPEVATSWEGIRDASKDQEIAAQMDEETSCKVIGQEDCLYLNVCTKSLGEPKQPVMFWIHGGAFVTGTGNEQASRGDYLVRKNIVLVSPNYRLGAFGFLNLGHKVAPGNAALKDLVVALQWVKENIGSFGGDENNVTIFGVSAGGILAHALTISPAAKGLFHKAIFQSGNLFCPWGRDQSRPERCFKLASLLGMDSKDPLEVFKFLQGLPFEKIIEVQSNIASQEKKYGNSILSYGVTDDKLAENPVLPCLDQLITKVADVPIAMGFTSHEYLLFFKDTSKTALKLIEYLMPKHVENLAKLLARKTGKTDFRGLLKKVRDLYFDGKGTICKDDISSIVRFFSELYFAIPTILLANALNSKKRAPIYLYKFSYVGNEANLTDLLLQKRAMRGASHTDELSYLFYMPICKLENREAPAVGTRDRVIMEKMTKLWTDFVKTGNPTPRIGECVNVLWKATSKEKSNCLEIGDDLKMLLLQVDILGCS